jgi:hypothetical protein
MCDKEQDALVVHEEGRAKGNLASMMALTEDKARRRMWVRPWAVVGREPRARRAVR